MNAVNSKTASVAAALRVKIDSAVKLQMEAERIEGLLSAERATIKELMESAGLPRFATADGHEALVIDCVAFVWNVEALQNALKGDEVDEYTPRKPEAAKLRKHFESDATFAERIKKCLKKRASTKLEVRAAGSEPVAA